jgi:hypothetical protein
MAAFLVIFFSRILSLPAQPFLGKCLKLRARSSRSTVFYGDENPQALKILKDASDGPRNRDQNANKIWFFFHGGNSLHVHLTSQCITNMSEGKGVIVWSSNLND